MKLINLLSKQAVKCGLAATDKNGALRELVDLLAAVDKKCPETADAIFEGVQAREKVRPFVVSNRVALAHVRTDAVRDFHFVLGTTREAIRFPGDDRRGVQMIVLFVIDQTSSNLYLKTLAAFAKMISEPGMVDALLACDSAEAVHERIRRCGLEVGRAARVADVMETSVAVLKPDDPVRAALDIFVQEKASRIPVVDAGRLVGVVCPLEMINTGMPPYLKEVGDVSFLAEFEPFEALLKKQGEMTIEDVMRSTHDSIKSDASLVETALKMVTGGQAWLPVVEGEKFVGVISVVHLLSKVILG